MSDVRIGPVKMHVDQVDITVGTVAALVAAQFPQWKHYPIRPVPSAGTVNAIFRLGDEIVLRFPLQPSLDPKRWAALEHEQAIARRMAAHVRWQVPDPIAIGEPGDGYAGPWTAYRWIAGETAASRTVGDPVRLARDLAEFVRDVHRMPTDGQTWNGRGRGGPLRGRDADVRANLALSTHLTDTVRLAAIWEDCLQPSPQVGPDVWIHADLMPGNLLVRDGRLVAVIDLESVCIGDPAVDLMPAWNLLAPGARDVFRKALGVDDATWERGRGWAIIQAIGALHYYVDTNPAMAETARHTLDAVLE